MTGSVISFMFFLVLRVDNFKEKKQAGEVAGGEE
jgi:hypothetical protein